MIVGHIIVFKRSSDDPIIENTILVEVTDTEKKGGLVEIAVDDLPAIPKNARIYLSFYLSDVQREIERQEKGERTL